MREDLIERLRVIAQWLDQRAHFESEPETKASHSEDADTCREAAAALEAAREDADRFAWHFASNRDSDAVLVELHMRALNGDPPTLDDWRTAIDQARG